MKLVIVIPTYNEQGSIGILLDQILLEFEKIEHDCNVLVVDGNSTDDTQKIVSSYAKKHDNINLMVEKNKSGLGAAYMKGFKRAMIAMDADVVMEMDADLQHDPKDIKRFISEIEKGADHVIGSRYIKGGSIPQKWAFYRKFLSKGGNIFAKVVLGIWDINDFTTGYKATRVKGVLDRLNLNDVVSNGFAYKIDLLVKMHNLGVKIKEIPIKFALRDEGKSKMERGNLMDSLRVVFSIKAKQSKRFLRFSIVGFVGMIVDFTFANLLRLSGVHPVYSATLAVIIAMVSNFTLNNLWTFEDRKIEGIKTSFKKFIVFIGISAVPIIFRFLFVWFIVNYVSSGIIFYNLAILFSIGIGLIWNFFSYSKFIWSKDA